MKSKLSFFKKNFITLCAFVVFLTITVVVFKLFQYMTCEVRYCIFDQLDHNNEVLIKFPPAETLQFVITGENLSFIKTINFEISSHNKKVKLISNKFERIEDKIILTPIMVSADQYIQDSFKSTETDTLPVSLFRTDGFRYRLKLSYKTINNNKIKAVLFMIEKIKLYNYSTVFNPLDTDDSIKSNVKNEIDNKKTPSATQDSSFNVNIN